MSLGALTLGLELSPFIRPIFRAISERRHHHHFLGRLKNEEEGVNGNGNGNGNGTTLASEKGENTRSSSLVKSQLGSLVAILLGPSFWAGAALLCGLYRPWRAKVTFALVFGPAGSILRYLLSRLLNPSRPNFPLGTFSANVLATAVLSLVFLLERTSPTRRPHNACAALEGIADGFCGSLSTVSTFVVELRSLDRPCAWRYLVTSVLVAFSFVVLIFGTYKWARGISPFHESCLAYYG
jgi:fluoride ion exporter CrcB/FEX